ncbi:MAG: glutathione S-transferase family protein, partial [Rhodospirillaceae bacterium]
TRLAVIPMRFTLHSRPASPFGRKVLASAAVLGLSDSIDFLDAADQALLQSQNPLGKVPALILEDGRALFDSRVIVEYLDAVAGGGRIIPAGTDARFDVLRLAALADGIVEAALLVVYERRYRPDRDPYEPWLDFQRGKIARSLAALDAAPPSVAPVTAGTIGLACALEYLDFRKPFDWRPGCPALVRWLDDFNAAVPRFADSRPGD